MNPLKRDWVCAECKNLNYSFRKYCNRCNLGSRDHPATRFINNKLNVLDELKLEDEESQYKKLASSNHSSTSTYDEVNDSDQETTVFSQALFVQDLSMLSSSYNKNFAFLKTCFFCNSQNYFYQQKCGHCNN